MLRRSEKCIGRWHASSTFLNPQKVHSIHIYFGNIRRKIPGEPSSWTIYGLTSVFQTGVTIGLHAFHPSPFTTSMDSISWTVEYLGDPITASQRLARMYPGIFIATGKRSSLYALLNLTSISSGTDIRPTRRTGAISDFAVSSDKSSGYILVYRFLM